MTTCKVYIFACLFVIGLLCAVATASAATTYYVANTNVVASDSNSGTLAFPWLTIGHAASVAVAGDIVRVQAGTYNEHPTLSTSGSSGAWINFVADGNAVCRGFSLQGVSYLRITGFEITHINTSFPYGIDFSGTCSHIDIIDNYVHNVVSDGVHNGPGAAVSYEVFRGNTFFYMGMVPGVATNFMNEAIQMTSVNPMPHHCLAEYNTVQRAADTFIVSFGTNAIVRNNYCFDFKNIYWNGDSSVHSDIFQDGSDGMIVGSRHHIYENNIAGDCIEANSHFSIWQDTVGAGDTNMLVRGNVIYNFGNGALGVISTKKVVSYNNSIYQITNGPAGSWYKQSTSTNYPDGAMAVNTIVDNVAANGSGSFYVQPGTANVTLGHNLGYLCPADSSFTVTNDPLFIDPSTNSRNFRLQAGSPAIGAGTNVVWVTSGNGSGNSFTVNDSQLLCDGWGIVDGDTITIGGTTTIITNIDWSTQTVRVRDSVMWTNGMAVYWGKNSTVDIGALPYGSSKLTAAAIAQSGSTYTVTTTGDARGVWFYVDGIPNTWISTPPFVVTITNGVVTAKAYAQYAQANPVVVATNGTLSGAPPPPTGVHVVATSP